METAAAHHGTALITLATSLLLFVCAAYVGRCRVRFGIKAPATTGHMQFEIAYRIQMNTIENVVIFLPVLWVFAVHVSELWATLLGSFWLVGRIWYALAYAREPRSRGAGFLLGMLSFGVLAVGAAWTLVRGVAG